MNENMQQAYPTGGSIRGHVIREQESMLDAILSLKNDATPTKVEKGTVADVMGTTDSQIAQLMDGIQRLGQALEAVLTPAAPTSSGSTEANANPGLTPLACDIWSQGQKVYFANRRVHDLLNRLAL